MGGLKGGKAIKIRHADHENSVDYTSIITHLNTQSHIPTLFSARDTLWTTLLPLEMQTFSSFLLFLGLVIAAPAQEAAEAPKINKRFNGGWCGVHVHTFDGENAKGSHEMNVWVYDGKQQLIWSKESIWGDGQLMAESEGLPLVLNINTHGPGDDVVSPSLD